MIFGEWRRWLNKLSRNNRGRAARRKRVRSARPRLESLESRAMMAGLIYEADLGYLGAFNVPQGEIGRSTFEYGGTAIAYNPVNSSLFMVGHDWDQNVAEISIPLPGIGS